MVFCFFPFLNEMRLDEMRCLMHEMYCLLSSSEIRKGLKRVCFCFFGGEQYQTNKCPCLFNIIHWTFNITAVSRLQLVFNHASKLAKCLR